MEPIRRQHIVRGITAVRRARCLSIETVAKEMGLSRHALRNLYRTNREPAQMTVWKIQSWLRKNALAVPLLAPARTEKVMLGCVICEERPQLPGHQHCQRCEIELHGNPYQAAHCENVLRELEG